MNQEQESIINNLQANLDNVMNTKIEEKNNQQIKDENESEDDNNVDLKEFSQSGYWQYGRRDLIHFACEKGRIDVVKKLLKQGISIESKDGNGWTPLFFAAYMNHLDLVKYLVSKNAQIDILDKNGCSPITRAKERNLKKMVRYLGKLPLPIRNENHFL